MKRSHQIQFRIITLNPCASNVLNSLYCLGSQFIFRLTIVQHIYQSGFHRKATYNVPLFELLRVNRDGRERSENFPRCVFQAEISLTGMSATHVRPANFSIREKFARIQASPLDKTSINRLLKLPRRSPVCNHTSN